MQNVLKIKVILQQLKLSADDIDVLNLIKHIIEIAPKSLEKNADTWWYLTEILQHIIKAIRGGDQLVNQINPENLDKIILASSQREDCQAMLLKLFELLPEKRNRLEQLLEKTDKSLVRVLETEFCGNSFKFADL